MSLIPWKGKQRERDDSAEMSPISSFRNEMDRLFDRFFGGAWDLAREGAFPWADWMPSIDVSETDTEVVVRAEVAGVAPKGIDVSLSGQVLTIAGEKKESTETQSENCYRSERRFGSFRRSLQLPASVDTEKVSAEHKNGVLTIRFKKLQSAQPKRIQVRSSGPDEK
jgi:HSP20 family protein